jgi:hypothetical protein
MEVTMELRKKITEIQQKLKAPKSQFNSFGKYSYRNCEDILEALKPLLGDVMMTISDDIVVIGNRYYVKATVTVSDESGIFTVSAYARESETKKGMDDSQITGATSSYARKYALNGMWLIDDTKDADSQKPEETKVKQNKEPDVPEFTPEEYITLEQQTTINGIIIDKDVDRDAFLKHMKANSVPEIKASDYQNAINVLRLAKGRKAA